MATPVPKSMAEGADVCPTEDAVKVFLDYLVEPKMARKSSAGVTLSLSDRELVAKQVHAVVLLYNYYHRKQHPHLEYVGFKSFCRFCAKFKPGLTVHFNFMASSVDAAPENLEKLLSLTEKKIMDACDISMALDISKNNPSLDGWPISKVAVFLVDSKKKNCMLHYGSIVDGVWSMIEKDVDSSGNHFEGSLDSSNVNKKRKVLKKPSKDNLCVEEADLEKLAYLAVKEATGIDQNDLIVLESHVTYSITKEKAVARLYIMKCIQPNNDSQIAIPIADAINSLQGPLVTKSISGWTHTSVVEYFHLLPYNGLLMDWFSRDLNVDNFQVQELEAELTGADNLEMAEILCEEKFPMAHLGSNKSSRFEFANRDDNGKDMDPLKLKNDGKVSAVTIFSDFDKKHENHRVQVDRTLAVNCIYRKSRNGNGNVLPFVDQRVEPSSAQRCSNGFTSSTKAETVDLRVRHQIDECRRDIKAHGNGNRMMLSLCRGETSTNALAVATYPNNDLDKLHGFIASKDKELSQAALRVLLGKRDKLSLQQRDLEDQVAQCDKDIHTIMSGGKDAMTLKIQSIIDGCNSANFRGFGQNKPVEDRYSTHPAKKKIVLASQNDAENPCQALDNMCYANNWILPAYHVSAQDGQFQANVIVKGSNCEHSSSGSLQANPSEARASAASEMLNKLWDDCGVMSQACLPVSYQPPNGSEATL